MKFSIRFSIASIFVLLLFLAISVVIGVNYYAMNRLLIRSSQLILKGSSNLIENQLLGFLKPIESRLLVSAQLLKRGLVNLDDEAQIRNYLVNIVGERPNFYAAYIADTQGNFFIVERDPDTHHLNFEVVNRDKQGAILRNSLIDETGQLLSQKKPTQTTYDPRNRIWYQNALKHTEPSWTPLYRYALTPGNNVTHGITVSIPIYAGQGKLTYVIAIDIAVQNIGAFMSEVKPTANTVMFIMDSAGKLLLPSELEQKKCPNQLCSLNLLQMPWIQQSFSLYDKKGSAIFSTYFQHKRYLSSYLRIGHLLGDYCIVGIVLPLHDIAGPLEINVILSILIAFIILVISLIIVRIVAGRIANPIVLLAEEAASIAELDLEDKPLFESKITEVIRIRDAFELMKKGLRSFLMYVPALLVRNLIKSGHVAEVGGQSKTVTLFFSDIKSFTTLSESMAPTQLMEFLSEYFGAMSQVIQESRGTIDKYIGDGIMAFWGAPLEDEFHAIHACQAALRCYEALDRLNENWKQKGEPTLQMRIGINTSEAVIGNIGAEDRLSYTALGDGVNLASRLESLSKVYGTSILINESTYRIVKDQFPIRLVDSVIVRGKSKGGKVYELLSSTHPLIANLDAYNKAFGIAFDTYQKGEWDHAIELFQNLAEQFGQDHLVRLYIDRCLYLKKHVPQNWNGVWMIDKA
ncbi:MAG: adenylate/guanylate cyclase domain-containing protein [Gammaproteobacteria bacterium]|nr:adenylate/guanylate cyclase domain-containing protein [Gammaproteobacteria bacterium]MBU1558411.1 adenylate/guanylate cyclase domain-containing protein [Gammaproteobacteria bacterium]MBU1927232.1 adenylate/guanylate cyclase domain-containing protein [Gammaproteobacteria bacterium]MBU2546475.1 adenylate/guanylate cyclase domain-containing protein [Gammaproteobacteria bacterium]